MIYTKTDQFVTISNMDNYDPMEYIDICSNTPATTSNYLNINTNLNHNLNLSNNLINHNHHHHHNQHLNLNNNFIQEQNNNKIISRKTFLSSNSSTISCSSASNSGSEEQETNKNNNRNSNNQQQQQQQHFKLNNNSYITKASREPKQRQKRVRTIFTPEQLAILEQEFSNQIYLVGDGRVVLAKMLDLSEVQVKVWFQNRRIKHRKLNQQSSPSPSSNCNFKI